MQDGSATGEGAARRSPAAQAVRARRLRRGAGALLAIGGLLTLWAPALAERALLFDAIGTAAQAGIDDGLARNGRSFASLSGMKALLASIEGSAVGVGFHFEVGDLVQPAYDAVDFVWHAFLYSLALLGLYKLLFETGLLGAGFAVLGVGLLVAGAGMLGLDRGGRTCRLGARIAALGLGIAYLLPLALLVTQQLGDRYLRPVEERAAARIAEAAGPLDAAAQQIGALREEVSILEPGRSLERVQEQAREAATRVSEAVWEQVQGFLSYVLVLLVELLALPFLSGWLILRAARGLLRGLEPRP